MIWQLIYKLILFPVLVVLVQVAALFSRKFKEGFYPKFDAIRSLQKWSSRTDLSVKKVHLHASSLGEFEHTRSLLKLLKQKYNSVNVVTVFSPSAYNNIKNTEGLDFLVYMPLDFRGNWKKFYKAFPADLVIISKHDIWPMHIWTAAKMKIPAYLINASLRKKSTRIKSYSKSFMNAVYSQLTQIYAVSEEDAARFKENYSNVNISLMGDTKYDQVIFRKNAAFQRTLIKEDWWNNSFVFIAGSIWPEDEDNILGGLKTALEKHPSLRLILVPHQPTIEHIENLNGHFHKFKTHLFSERENIKNARVLIMDRVGYLAEIYRYGHLAYVGGSFKQGIHNVIEAAVYGIPVIYGPTHQNSFEAISLAEAGGGLVIKESAQFSKIFEKCIQDDNFRKETGEKALKFSLRNTGATEKIVNSWKKYFD